VNRARTHSISTFVPLLLFVTACHDQRTLPPPSTDARSAGMLLLALEQGAIQWATAFDLIDGRGYPPIAWRGDVELIALEYGCSIERLGLAAGRQPLLAEPTDVPRLPPPRRVMSTRIDTTEWEPSEMSEPISLALRHLDLDPDNICTSARAAYSSMPVGVPVDGHADPSFAIPYDGETALIGSTDGKVYRLSRDGVIARVPALEDREYRGAYRAPRGDLWLISNRGTLARGTIDGVQSVTTTTSFTDPRRGIAIAGPNDVDAPFELFATATSSDTRVFARFDGERWEKLAEVEPHDGLFLPAAAWLGPEHAIAIGVGRYRNSVVRYREGVIREERLPTDAGPSSIMHHPTLGTIVGMDDGTIARNTGSDQWEAIPLAPPLRFVRTLAPVGDGFVFGASAEFNFLSYQFGQYFPAIGFCEGEVLTPDAIAASHLTSFADGSLIAATLQGFNSPLGIVILELEEEAGTCSQD
jgi:hypothetical protein